VLFIDARKLGVLVDRTRRELSDADVQRIADTYHAWRGEPKTDEYLDIAGFCKAASTDDIRKQGHILTPSRYVGTEEVEDDGRDFAEKFHELKAELETYFQEAEVLSAEIRNNLKLVSVD
jgi:type I restriction enzyme M protein